ncbi:unnamed protein product, partial [Ilex paraguariensis]
MQSDEDATSMELEKVLSESNRVSFASKPNFAPLKAHEYPMVKFSSGKSLYYRIDIRLSRKAWMEIYTLIYEQMKIDIHMNLKARKVELKIRSDTPDI